MRRRSIAVGFLAAYLTLLFYLTLIAFPMHDPHPDALLNPIPFETIAHDLHAGGRGLVINLLGNLVVFLPLGFLVPILRASRTSALRVALCCMLLSLLIEALQYGSGRRIADVDDVLLNTLSGVLGYAIFVGLRRRGSRVLKPPAGAVSEGRSS